MNVHEAIHQRRAVRDYLERKVDRKTLSDLLHAAVNAPSAVNAQPWAFAVIQDPQLMARISEAAKSHLHLGEAKGTASADPHFKELFERISRPDFNIFYNAGTLVVIYAHVNGYDPTGDCFLAGENLMLAACELGLGSCPIGFARDVLKQPEFRRELAVPAGYEPVLPIILGYPRGETPPVQRKEPQVFCWRE